MELGMINWIREEDFAKVHEKGLSFVELDVNDRAQEFLDNLERDSRIQPSLSGAGRRSGTLGQ